MALTTKATVVEKRNRTEKSIRAENDILGTKRIRKKESQRSGKKEVDHGAGLSPKVLLIRIAKNDIVWAYRLSSLRGNCNSLWSPTEASSQRIIL